MRKRTKSDVVGPRFPLRRTDENTGMGSESVSPFSTAYVGTESIMEDLSTPGFISKLEDGTVVMNPMVLTRRERVAEENPVVVLGPTGPYKSKRTFSGDFAGYFAYGHPNRLAADLAGHKSRALTNAYAKMYDSAILGGEILGTIGQTVAMLKRPFGTAQKLLKKMLKRIKSRQYQHRLWYKDQRRMLRKQKRWHQEKARVDAELAGMLSRVGPEVWLEMRYGWLPAMADTVTVIGMIHESINNAVGKFRVARGDGDRVSQSDSYSGHVGCWLSEVIEPVATIQHSYLGRVSAGVVYRCKPVSRAQEVFGDLGLDLSSVPSTLWELIPASFVLDWYVNVGTWIRAVTPRPGITPLANWITTVEEWKTSVGGISFKSYFGWTAPQWHYASFPPGFEKKTRVCREVSNSLPSTPLVIGQRLGRIRELDAVSLSCTAVVGKLKQVISHLK